MWIGKSGFRLANRNATLIIVREGLNGASYMRFIDYEVFKSVLSYLNEGATLCR